MSDLYQKIEKLCKQKNVNVTEMCRESGVSRGNMTDLKKGRSKTLSSMSLSKIANYFGISIDYLLGYETPPSILEFVAEGNGLHSATQLLMKQREPHLAFGSGGAEKKPAPKKGSGLAECQLIYDSLSPENQAKLLELARLFLDAQRNKGDTK